MEGADKASEQWRPPPPNNPNYTPTKIKCRKIMMKLWLGELKVIKILNNVPMVYLASHSWQNFLVEIE